jgi:G3E family GTPase
MIIHLISGFLGSGKTTAIVNAVGMLTREGITCAVITNDQGTSLVDSQLMAHSGIPFAEVTGGCFCCNYDQFETNVWILNNRIKPDVIFAETVGSCTDLVATVLKPLWKFQGQEISHLTLSTLADARLLSTYLNGKDFPFCDDTLYIWEKQIEESEILIVNKTDLISADELKSLVSLANKKFPSKKLLFQNSLDEKSLSVWLEVLKNSGDSFNRTSIDIDYNRYGRGEASLAWLDEEIEISSQNNTALMITHQLLGRLTHSLFINQLPVGHLKFFLEYNDQQIKISHTVVLNRKLFDSSPPEKTNRVHILINARVQTNPEFLRTLVKDSLDYFSSEPGISIKEKKVEFFKPGLPNPMHRWE